MSTKLRLLILILIIITVWFGGLFYFVSQIPSPQQDNKFPDSIEAIVALTGGSKRIQHAVTLLSENPNTDLLISGVDKKTTWNTLDEKYNISSISNDIKKKVTLGNWATNTESNAVETLAWMLINEHQNIALVTANYHLPRAHYELNVINPDANITPYAVVPDEIKMDSWLTDTTTLKIFISEYHKYIVARLRAWVMGY